MLSPLGWQTRVDSRVAGAVVDSHDRGGVASIAEQRAPQQPTHSRIHKQKKNTRARFRQDAGTRLRGAVADTRVQDHQLALDVRQVQVVAAALGCAIHRAGEY